MGGLRLRRRRQRGAAQGLRDRDQDRHQRRGVDTIARTLPLGNVGYEAEANERSERYVWLAPTAIDRLRAMRRPTEELQRRHPEAGFEHLIWVAPLDHW